MNTRIEYIDIAKALGIIFVVIGHSGMWGSNFIYLFHIPLFFFISGYFYNDKYTISFKEFIGKRIKSLYIPFLKFELVFLVLHNFFCYLSIYSDNFLINIPIAAYNTQDFINNISKILFFNGTELLLSPLWFLTSLFIVNILFWCISRISLQYGNKLRLFLSLLCFCFGNLLTKWELGHVDSAIFVPQVISVSMVAVLIFYLGYLYKKYEKIFTFNKYFFLNALLMLLLFWRYNTGMDMRINLYPNPAFMLMTTILGVYCTFYISKKISNYQIKNVMKYISKYTITIMALHLLCFKIIDFLQIQFFDLPYYMLGNFGRVIGSSRWSILYVIVGVMGPLLLVAIKNGIYIKKKS